MAVTRVYPRTISGTPTSFSFDPNKQTFRFEYKPILPSGQRGTSPTHIVVPSSLYGKSPVYTVTGGTFTQLLGGYDILVRADAISTTVTVNITP